MKVSFVESMQGTVRDRDGVERPLDFHVKAETESLRAFGRGISRLSGLMHAPPWARETPTEGTLEMSLAPPRLAYRLEFRSLAGETLVLSGQKDVRLTSFLRTMTQMPVVLRSGDKMIAEGELRFLLTDLPPFLASWNPLTRRAQRELDTQRRAVERRALSGA